ncbi:hypothetical protein FS837_004585 [Tulasnella sp. UAMH 9824]|nr:hypothetical protein FS837_004585 [Tulasnella sp. UAMH 9824]
MGKLDAHGFTGQNSSPAGWKSVDSRTILLAAIAFCYMIASILEMTSLLSFSPQSGAAQCGRFVITAGVLEHLATLLAFIYASIDIRLLGGGKWEQRGFFLLVGGAFGLQCAEAGLITLTVNRLPMLKFGFCWRTRPATLCAVNAVIGILFGIYVSARLYATVVPEPTFAWRSQMAAFGDVRVTRGLSLLSLGLLTFLPGIASVGVAGDVIPLAVASVVVLELFGIKNAPSDKRPSDDVTAMAIRVELFTEPLSPTGRSDESNELARSPKPLGLSASRLMELNGSQIGMESLADNGRMPSPPQTGRPSGPPQTRRPSGPPQTRRPSGPPPTGLPSSPAPTLSSGPTPAGLPSGPASMQEPIVPRLAHIMNAAFPPAPPAPPVPRSPTVSEASVTEITTARRIKRSGTGTTVGKSIRSVRPVSFLTTQNPYPDQGFPPPSPVSAARTEFELTTTEEDDGLARSETMSTRAQAVSRNPSSTATHWQGDVSRAAPSASDRWKNIVPVAPDRNERMERSISRRTFGAESQRSVALTRGPSQRQSVPSTPVSELPPSHPPLPFMYSSKQLPIVPPS